MKLLNSIPLFVTLQILDVTTTLFSMRIGAQELNPIINYLALFIGFIPSLLSIKIVFCSLLIWFLIKRNRIGRLWLVNSLFILVCTSNTLVTGYLLWMN